MRIIAHWGSGPAYLAVAASYLVGAAALLPASAGARATPSASGSLWQSVVDFVAMIRNDRALLALMALTAAAEILGFSHQALLPSLARDVLHTGPQGLGALNAARSVGGIIGLTAAMRGSARGGGMFFVAVLVFFGASVASLGLAPYVTGFSGVLLVLTAANAAGALADLLAQSLLQLAVPAALRGRAGGAWVVAIGLAPLGQLQIGGLASLFGVSVALGVSGLTLAVAAVLTGLLFPRIRRL